MEKLPETKRLYMRQFTLNDAQMLWEMHQDPAITKYTGDPVPWTDVPMVEAILEGTILPQYAKGIGRWAVHRKEDDAFLGWCGLKDLGNQVDLGYRYMQQFWNKGYATEAAKAVLQYGLDMKLQGIVGRAAVANTASVKVLHKIGMVIKEYYEDEGVASVLMIPR